MKLKQDWQIIHNAIDANKALFGSDPLRKWWPDYLFHYTDVRNAASVLTTEHLYSRHSADNQSLMLNDNASPDVIAQTVSDLKKYVRFYFRPRTPTQYRNEGVRPKSQLYLGGAHCPVPIFFLFNSRPLLSMENSLFSPGSLAVQHPKVYSTGTEFMSMPFQDIYHEGPYDRDLDSHIKYHRHAEVIIPESVSLEHLHLVICRSPAERETLLQLLPPDIYQKWVSKITVMPQTRLFYGYWTFVERVVMTREKIIMTIKPEVNLKGTFEAKLEIIETATHIPYSWVDGEFIPRTLLTFELSNLSNPSSYRVEFYLDGNLVYAGSYQEEINLPF